MQLSPQRIHVALHAGWQFLRRRMGRRWLAGLGRHDGVPVDLPHCWNDRDTFQPGVAYDRGWGSYRRAFSLPEDPPAAGRLWTLRSEGFYGTGDVFLNGRKLAAVDGQFLGFTLPIAPPPPSSGVLGIRLNNLHRADVLPGIRMPDFLLHGGLAGRLWLEGTSDLHLEDSSICLRTSDPLSARPTLTIGFEIHNASARARRATLRWTVTDATGNAAAVAHPRDVTLPAGERVRFEDSLSLRQPVLWSPDTPALYTAQGLLEENGVALDSVARRFGVREASFRPEAGFFLNGARLELHGCNRHGVMPGFGNALPESLEREDARLLKELGCNFVRLSHYPQHPAFLDACDALGIMVYAEIATWKSVRGGGRWLRAACRQMRAMILRDRNHPGIILWGMGNESRSRRAYLALRDVAQELDPTRAVIYAENHFHRARRSRTLGIPDVWGCNYELEQIAAGCAAARLRAVVVSECSNAPDTVRGDVEAERRQVEIVARDLERFRQTPCVAGFALWCFHDYATLRKRRYRRHSGLVDAWRVPKMSAALMQALYRTDPFLRIFGNRRLQAGAASATVHVFTNCDTVEISLNGRGLTSLQGAPHVAIETPLEAGELRATGTRRGQSVSDCIRSHGAAHAVHLTPDSRLRDTARGGVLGVWIRVVDAEGHTALDWNGHVAVDVSGPGTLRNHVPDDRVPVSGGIGRAFVSPAGTAGAISVRAAAPGLTPGEICLSAREEPLTRSDQAGPASPLGRGKSSGETIG